MTTKPLSPEQVRETLEGAEQFLERVTDWLGSDEAECQDTLESVRKTLASLPNTDVQGVSEGVREKVIEFLDAFDHATRTDATEEDMVAVYRLEQPLRALLASLPASQETVSDD
jgi:hypothetical protein